MDIPQNIRDKADELHESLEPNGCTGVFIISNKSKSLVAVAADSMTIMTYICTLARVVHDKTELPVKNILKTCEALAELDDDEES